VSQAGQTDACPFCQVLARGPEHDREQFVLERARHNFILLNLYPYTTGHLLITPYDHVARLDQVRPDALTEMMELARKLQAALDACYHPQGYNLGMNFGRCAGAGVEDHVHLHLVPRWSGDSNFMTVVGETRVHPEDLLTTYDKLRAFLTPQRSLAG